MTNERLINGVALRYSEAMTEPNVEDLKNYDIYLRKESKRLGGFADLHADGDRVGGVRADVPAPSR